MYIEVKKLIQFIFVSNFFLFPLLANAEVLVHPQDEFCFRDSRTFTNYTFREYIKVDSEGSEPITKKKYPFLFSIPTQKSDYCLKVIEHFEMKQDEDRRMKEAYKELERLSKLLSKLRNQNTQEIQSSSFQRRKNVKSHELNDMLFNEKQNLKYLQDVELSEQSRKINVVENLLLKEEEKFRLDSIEKKLEKAEKEINRNKSSEINEADMLLKNVADTLQQAQGIKLEKGENFFVKEAEDLLEDANHLMDKISTSNLDEAEKILDEQEEELKEIYGLRLKEINKLNEIDNGELVLLERRLINISKLINSSISKSELAILDQELDDLKLLEAKARRNGFFYIENNKLKEAENNKFLELKKLFLEVGEILDGVEDVRFKKLQDLKQKRMITLRTTKEIDVIIKNTKKIFIDEVKKLKQKVLKDIKLKILVDRVSASYKRINDVKENLDFIESNFLKLEDLELKESEITEYARIKGILSAIRKKIIEIYSLRIYELNKIEEVKKTTLNQFIVRFKKIKKDLKAADSYKLSKKNDKKFIKLKDRLKDFYKESDSFPASKLKVLKSKLKEAENLLQIISNLKLQKVTQKSNYLQLSRTENNLKEIKKLFKEIVEANAQEYKSLKKNNLSDMEFRKVEVKVAIFDKRSAKFERELLNVDEIILEKVENLTLEKKIYLSLKNVESDLKEVKNLMSSK